LAVVVHYCDKCGIRIEPEDIQEEKALLLGDKAFCPSCAQKVMSAEAQPVEEAKTEKPASKRRQPVRVAPPRKKTTASVARRPKRERRVDEYEQPEEKPEGPPLPKKKSPVPLILGVCGVLVVIIIIAIAASGGGKPGTEKPEISEKPGGPPVSGPGPGHVVEGPIGPAEGPAEESKALKRLEEAEDYGRRHPEDYAKVTDMLESIMREEAPSTVDAARVQRVYDDWKVRWETAAEAQWKKTTAAAEELAAKGENEKGAKLWDDFPEKFRKLDTYDQDAAAEAKKLRDQQVALEALKEIEGDLAAAEKQYTLETLEEAEGVLKRLGEFGRKHEDIKPLVERILPVYNSLKEKVEKIWKEREAKEMEEWLKDQNEKREEEARQREQQDQQRWAALKALWQKTYANYDQGAAQSLPLGNYTIFDGASNKGWIVMTGRDDNVTWSFSGTISGTNNGAKGSVLATHYKQAYLWENYTFTAKVRVIKGTCFIGVRANINEQNQISATRFLPGTGTDWVDVKVEVNGNTATSFVNGNQTGSLGTDYPAGYPAIFLQPNSQVEVKEITIDLKSTKN
jgi:hypothetical protein